MDIGKLDSIISTERKFKRFIWILVIVLTTLLIGFIILLYHQYKSSSNLQIDFTKNGATVIIMNNQPVAAQFLLPASARWTNTGIKLKPNTTVQVTASGKVHLAAHRLIEAADLDRMPPFDWCSPKGLDFKSKRPRDVYRRNFLINPEAPMGVIIGYLQKDGEPEPGMQNPRPKNLITIYEQTEIDIPNYNATLWLIINDVWLDPKRLKESKEAYYGPEGDLTIQEKKEKDANWEYILSKDYWDIWYDDNFGNYLIQLKSK